MIPVFGSLLSQFKFYFIAAAIAAVTFLLWQSHNFAYTAGADSVKLKYEKAAADQLQQNQAEIAAAIAAAKQDAKTQRAKVIAELDAQRELSKKLEAINHEIINAHFDCPDVGSEFLRLFNAPIRAANCSDQQCSDQRDIPSPDPAASVAAARVSH